MKLASAVLVSVVVVCVANAKPKHSRKFALDVAEIRNDVGEQFDPTDDDLQIIIMKVGAPTNESRIDEAIPKPLPRMSAKFAERFGLLDIFENRNGSSSEVSRRFKRAKIDAETEPEVSDEFWSKERVKGAESVNVPTVSKDTLEKLGIDPNARPRLMAGPTAKVETANVNQAPYDAYGKLFFTDSRGRNYECSGAYIDPKIVLTAAHCVYDTESQEFHKNYQFFQQFDKGQGKKKGVKKTLLFKGWYNKDEPGFMYDYAFLAMRDESSAGHLALDTIDDYEDWTAAGYPSNYFQGRVLQKFHGYKGRVSDEVVELMDDPMGQGCSGGAWFVEKANKKFGAVGVNSFAIEGKTSMFSPRIKSEAAMKLFKQAKKLANS